MPTTELTSGLRKIVTDMINMIAHTSITGFDLIFDGKALLLMLLGIAFRFGLEWYNNVQSGGVVNLKELIVSSLLAILGYVIFVVLGEVKLDPGDALIIGLAPQTIINEVKRFSESKKIAVINKATDVSGG